MRRLLGALAIGLGLIALTASCDEVQGSPDGGVKPDQGAPPSGVVFFHKANESAEVDLTEAATGLLVVPYSVSEVSADSISFDIKVQSWGTGGEDAGVSTTNYPLTVSKYAGRMALEARNPALWARWQRRLAVERWQRSLIEQAARSRLVPEKGKMSEPLSSCTVSSACGDNEVCHEGTCSSSLTIKVSKFSASDTITAEVKKKGTNAAILVDSEDSVGQAAIDSFSDTFDKLIYPRVTGLFGNPPLKSGSSQLSSDRNGDGLIWILLTSKVAEKGADGFFVATDFEETAAESNKADILYVDASLEPAKVYGTLAHELQHLFNFGTKVYRAQVAGQNSTPQEALWLDEGQSHFAEDACGFGGENVTMLDEKLFPSFGDTRLLESSEDSMEMRAMAYTFVRYIFEQAGGVSYTSDGGISDKGGAALLAKLHTSSKLGTAAVAEAIGESFAATFDNWIVAVALDGRKDSTGAPVTTYGKWGYQSTVDDPAQSGPTIGLTIRGTRKDAEGNDVTLEGPLDDEISGDKDDTIPNASAKFFLLKGQSGKVKVSVESQETDVRFALIPIK